MNVENEDTANNNEDINAKVAPENNQATSTPNAGNCNCSKNCNCDDNCKCRITDNHKSGCCIKGKNCLPTALSILACVIACLALSKTCHKPCISVSSNQSQNTAQIDDSRMRTTIINVIKNDPQMLIDAMSAGIAKQRADLSKQQAQSIEKYKDELINSAYLLGSKDAKTTILCLFDPICSGCIEFQHMMLKALKDKKDVCFYIVPVAALGPKAEEVAKAYYAVHAKEPSKLMEFISKVIKDPSDLEQTLNSVSVSQKDLDQLKDIITKEMETNLGWLDKLRINSVPALFIKHESGKFTSIDENELIAVLK